MPAAPSQKRPIGRWLGEEGVEARAARGFAVAIVDDDRGHARGGDAIDQTIGFLVLVAGPISGDVDAIVTDFERQVRNRRIEVEQPRHVGLGVGRDVPEIMAGHDELPGAGAIIEAHGIGHPVIDLASALVAKQ